MTRLAVPAREDGEWRLIRLQGGAVLKGGSILVLCTGNVCRSPYIEMRLRHDLAGTGIDVTSAGTHALVGRPMDAGSTRLLEVGGVSVQDFRARQLARELVAEADLVLATAREHRSAAARLYPSAMRTALTLRDLADLLAGVTPADVRSRDLPGSWVAQVVSTARARRALVPARQDGVDVSDPIGLPQAAFVRMANEVELALAVIVPVLRGASER